jgi:hypothetical protein
MESELLQTKERLAVERRAQQHQRPAIGDSAGAAWAHMRQRLARAEREARGARRLTIALSCVTLAAVAGVIAVELPWSTTLGSQAVAGEALVGAGEAHIPFVTPAGHGVETQPPLFGLADDPAPSLEQPSASTSPDPGHPVSPTPAASAPPVAGPGASSPASGAAHRTPPGAGQPKGTRTLPRKGVAVASAGVKRSPPTHVSPAPEQRPQMGRRSHRALRASMRRRPRAVSRRRWPRYALGHSRSWRVIRLSKAGSATYCLVDPHGNWWKAERVRPRGERRGEKSH